MQTQDSFSLPLKTEYVSDPSETTATIAPKSPVKGIAMEQLNMGRNVDKPADLDSKFITQPPGVFASIKKFFERRFSEIKEADKQKGQEINLFIGKVERDLQKITMLAKKAANTERMFKGKFPDDKSVEASREYLDESHALLVKAKDHLADLKEEETEAERLADMHSTYSTLPSQILTLENNILYLDARIKVAEKVLELEEIMKNYQPTESWDQFMKATEQRKKLARTLRDIITQNPVLKNDPTVQKYIDKPHWNAYDIYQLMKTTFPGLKGQVERLFDNTIEMQKNRIQKLEKQVDELKPLFSKYAQQSKYISNLEKSIYDHSILGRVYRIFYGKKYLKVQLEKVIREQKETYQTIQNNAQFNKDELDWLKKIAKTTHPDKMDLRKDIEALQRGIGYLKVRQNLSNQMSKMLRHLEFYRKHNLHVQDKNDNDFIDYTKLEEALQKDMQEIAGNVKNWSYKQEVLPTNFTKMVVIDQLKTVISSSFPTLQERSTLLFQLIKELGLHEDLNQAILDGKPLVTEQANEEPIETEEEEEESSTCIDANEVMGSPSYETIITPSSSISIEEETEEKIIEEEELNPETTETKPQSIPTPPPIPDPFIPKAPPVPNPLIPNAPPIPDPLKSKEDKKEYKKVEVERPKIDSDEKKVKPSTLLDDIKKGKTLNHVEPEEKKPEEKMGFLADVEKGVSLKKVEAADISKPVILTVKDYAAMIENGEMKIDDVPQEIKANLTVTEILLLKMASNRKDIETTDTDDSEEWAD